MRGVRARRRFAQRVAEAYVSEPLGGLCPAVPLSLSVRGPRQFKNRITGQVGRGDGAHEAWWPCLRSLPEARSPPPPSPLVGFRCCVYLHTTGRCAPLHLPLLAGEQVFAYEPRILESAGAHVPM